MKEMVGGCCVCSDERGWPENPLVYCDGQGCNVAVHQACYGIVQVPTGPWFCRKCESQERSARVRCELCPSKDGALKRTDGGGWAHVVCALYIPEVRFGNVTTMEPIILQLVPQERYNKTCCICEEQGKESKASVGACMQCNKSGCKQYFHVTCAQAAGLLCEEAGNYTDNVKYCGYCYYHYQKLKKDSHIKIIPAFKPIPADNATPEPSPEKITSAHLKEKTTRSKADRKGRQAVYTNNSVSANNTETSSPNLATNIEQEFLSDSSTSTISNSSLNNGITVNNSDSRNSDIKTKKNDLHANSNSSIGSKFNSNFKDSNATPSGSPVHNNEKPKKKSKDSGATSSKKNVQESKDLQDISTKSAAPTFSSMYENFISKDLDSNQNSKNDKKRSSDFPEEPEKKKSKHSRSKSKLKSIIESVIPPEKSNPQIPIVRIKRKFNHDRSCSSHSVEEVSVDAPKDYETIIDKIDPESVPEPVKPTEGEIILNSNPSPPIRNPPGEKNESLPLLNDAEIKTEEPSFYDIPRTSYVIPIPDTVNLMDKLSKQMPDSPTVAEDNMQQPAPTTLEELLEKQWVETSNFLISQGQHFDVASMISCLHELRNENNRLEKQISDLVSRRDSLLSINARLKVLPGSAENSMSNNMHYSPLSLLNAKPISPERHISAATANFTGYTLFDNALVHSAQWNNAFSNPLDPTRRDFISHKSPMTGHSPIATVGTSSLPLTPSPIPCSPISKNEVYPHLSAFSHESSPLSHIPNVTNTTSQSSHLYGPSVAISDSLLINETSSYNTLNCPNGSNDAQDEQPTTAVYQTISPPFSNPETDSPNNTSLHSVCSNIVFHPNFENALQNNSRLEDER
ncbi:protein AF-10-like isoform X2 [Argiope bruennichi]|uniref:protein AF-10-like isoform X2 n=1 Tax=Argiope bruennichi TaxID=94029 RepID=UPI002494EFC9|nr:protein AF-10-like isoform X2 [Argiope bruennichi]